MVGEEGGAEAGAGAEAGGGSGREEGGRGTRAGMPLLSRPQKAPALARWCAASSPTKM